MNRVKRLWAAALVLSLCLSYGLTALALPEDYVVEDGALVAYTGAETELYLPEEITAIRAEALSGAAQVEKIVIPSAVTDIDPGAFDGCPNAFLHVTAGSYAQSFAVVYGLLCADYPSDAQLPWEREEETPSFTPTPEPTPVPTPEPTAQSSAPPEDSPARPTLPRSPSLLDLLREPEGNNLITLIVLLITLILLALLIVTIVLAIRAALAPAEKTKTAEAVPEKKGAATPVRRPAAK